MHHVRRIFVHSPNEMFVLLLLFRPKNTLLRDYANDKDFHILHLAECLLCTLCVVRC